MKQAVRQIAACAAALLLFCAFCRLTFVRNYDAYFPVQPHNELRAEDLQLEMEQPGVLRTEQTKMENGTLRISVRPERAGETWLTVSGPEGEHLGIYGLRVGPLMTVYDLQTGGFTGDGIVLTGVTVFWLLVSLIMVWHYSRAKGPSFYGYGTIYFAGFSLFSISTFFLMLEVTLKHVLKPADYNMMTAYGAINGAPRNFMMLTTPAVMAFAVAMAVSNLVLLRHEKTRWKNLLGLTVSFMLLAGTALGWILFTADFSGSEWESRVRETFINVYATAFVYFECMLTGAVICGFRAARNEPRPDKDFIVILGCWFRKDGTLPPLLQGRVDRAVEFWRKQKNMTGKEAILIPSGGQGPDESMPEAEAMRRYLLSQNIPEELIRPETQSANTWQNMVNSKKIIREINPGGRTVFATTNYHVFRSGVWAAEAGLPAEGIGSRTRWWYWPNAFMRECAGLLLKQWKREVLMLILLTAFFGVLSMIL